MLAPSSPPRIDPTGSLPPSSSFDVKRHPKESQFTYKHGQRHHSFDPEKAPYPVSYDRCVLELESLGLELVRHVRQSISFVDFTDGPPTRCLDLGCGHGTWVIDAAKEWPDCHFIGFDLVNVQISQRVLDPSISRRIQWMHGNFLTTKLPFDEDEFDHVHIHSIARGVPENKWGVLFEEVNRVLRPDGVVEVVEDDILFPLLPRWFTTPLRVRTRRAASIHYPESSQRVVEPSPLTSNTAPPHDHALLESLYQSIFESRFINLRPTAVLPAYFTTYFRQVILGPVIHFPMPPLPPIQPLPRHIIPLDEQAPKLPHPSGTHVSFASMASPSPTEPTFQSDTPPASTISDPSTFSVRYYTTKISGSETISSSPSPPSKLASLDRLNTLCERSLAMNLYRAYQNVLASQEAMWEELKDRIRNRKDQLKQFGWEDDEELEELQNRSKFERIVERYRSDMQTRVALWASLINFGWSTPQREPLSKAELIEEERLHQAMLEARASASPEDFQLPCRTTRVLIGSKSYG